MPRPLLVLEHDWHRSRANLRNGRLRPPPLVAAGIDLSCDPTNGRSVKVGGIAVIFGTFPANCEDLVALARTRLSLGDHSAPELGAVLNTRILAMWAWLPTRRCDLYLEYDRATGDEHLWLIGPGPEDARELDLAAERTELDGLLLESLVLNGSAGWGGAAGLERLVNRFGHHPLLAAARIADHLEHHPREPRRALDLAREVWARLDDADEVPWADLAGNEHPWVCVQLGRLALRLGLLRAARLLLSSTAAATNAPAVANLAPIALFDLGQACEALDDLASAEDAFARFAAARPTDPDAWRRLLFCRLRLGHGEVAEETLKRYRGCGGKDEDLVARLTGLHLRQRLSLETRAQLAGWLAARLDLGESGQPLRVLDEVLRRRLRSPGSERTRRTFAALNASTSRLRQALVELITAISDAPVEPAADQHADTATAVVLHALPLLAAPARGETRHSDDDLARHALDALHAWWRVRLPSRPLPALTVAGLNELATIAASLALPGVRPI